MSDFLRERAVAEAAVIQASLLCRRVQCQLTPEAIKKSDRSPVTIADFGSQALLCRALQGAFEDPIMAEEDSDSLRRGEHPGVGEQIAELLTERIRAERPAAGNVQITEALDWIDGGNLASFRPRFWTIDPIDGTRGFLRGDQYAVAVALLVEGEAVVGLLGCPNFPVRWVPGLSTEDDEQVGVVFSAVAGRDAVAFKLDEPDRRAAIRVAELGDRPPRLCESVESGHTAQGRSAQVASAIGAAREPLRIDSQAKYAAVGCGAADLYLRLPTKSGRKECLWDHAAGALVVAAAGGAVTDLHGRPLEFTHGMRLQANEGILAASPELSTRVVETLAQM